MSVPAALVPPPLPSDPLVAALLLAAPLAGGVVLAALAQHPGTLAYRLPLFALVELGCWRALGGLPLASRAARFVFGVLNLTHILGIVFAPRLLLREPLVLLAPLDPAAPYPHGIAASLRQGLRFLADAQGTDFAPQPPYFVPHRPRSPPHPGRPLSARQHVARALLNSVGAGAIALVLQACFPSVTADFTLRRPLDAPMPLIPRRWQPLPRFATQYVWSATVGLFLLLFLVRAGAHTLACLGIALGGLPPDGYVEPADRPWAADGLHTFWSARWHGYLVPTMRFYSAVVVPRAVVPAPAARAVLGPFVAFAVAAVLHDVFLLPAVAFPARPHLSAISLYFVLQPVGMLAERAFARLTGRRVRGPLGRLWLAAWFTATSPFFVDSAFHVWAAPGLPMR